MLTLLYMWILLSIFSFKKTKSWFFLLVLKISFLGAFYLTTESKPKLKWRKDQFILWLKQNTRTSLNFITVRPSEFNLETKKPLHMSFCWAFVVEWSRLCCFLYLGSRWNRKPPIFCFNEHTHTHTHTHTHAHTQI